LPYSDITSGSNNIAFGQNAGCFLSGSSSNNITIGFEAGPSTLTEENDKLYIASGSGTPLIKGDFAAKTVDISGSLTATSFTGSLLGTASNSLTASYLNTLNQDLTFNGNLTLNGTASITYLNVSYESASVIYSSGSNQFGDASNDTQTLWGTVDVKTGPVLVTGSIIATSGFTGSLLGTANNCFICSKCSNSKLCFKCSKFKLCYNCILRSKCSNGIICSKCSNSKLCFKC
jgi:hypothetical protein